MNAQEESARGNEARLLIENKIYQDTLKTLRDGITQKWRDCPIRDKEGQHELKLMDKILTDIEKHIKQVADTGKMADILLAQEEKIELLRKAGIR
jgi:hypothetical protein